MESGKLREHDDELMKHVQDEHCVLQGASVTLKVYGFKTDANIPRPGFAGWRAWGIANARHLSQQQACR